MERDSTSWMMKASILLSGLHVPLTLDGASGIANLTCMSCCTTDCRADWCPVPGLGFKWDLSVAFLTSNRFFFCDLIPFMLFKFEFKWQESDLYGVNASREQFKNPFGCFGQLATIFFAFKSTRRGNIKWVCPLNYFYYFLRWSFIGKSKWIIIFFPHHSTLMRQPKEIYLN